MSNVLIIEDEEAIRQELVTLLERNGYNTFYFDDFRNLAERIIEGDYDMVLLDINLPGVDGGSVLRDIRRSSDVPVIMVTSKDTEMDEVLCMSFGADDFISKPYNPSILLLHMEAILKRNNKKPKNNEFCLGNVKLDPSRGVLMVNNDSFNLSKNEIGILSYMLEHSGVIVSRDDFMSYLWDSEEFVDDNTLTVNINRVRKKLSDAGADINIITKRGQGYILEKE